MKKTTILLNHQRFENWQTIVLSGHRRLNDGSYIMALITTVRIEDDALWHKVYIYPEDTLAVPIAGVTIWATGRH